MLPMVRITLQEANEERYSRKHIDKKIKDELLSEPVILEKIEQGVQLIEKWLAGQYYESKMQRLAQLKELDIPAMVLEIFVGVTYTLKDELFTSVSARMAGRLGMSDKPDAILTMAEMLTIVAATDVYDITKAGASSSLMFSSRIRLPDELVEYIEHSEYLPPMVCEPKVITSNYESGYLTHNDSLILGKGNHHEGDICLDVINLVNKVPLSLDTEFLSVHEETPKEITVEGMKMRALKKRGEILDDVEAKERVAKAMENWDAFKLQSYKFYSLMQQQGNRFWITNKVDKRGRLYAQGYHISPQGASFKKAMLEFADKKPVEGVPTI